MRDAIVTIRFKCSERVTVKYKGSYKACYTA